MKKFFESVFVVVNFLVFLPIIICAIFFVEVTKAQMNYKEKDTALMASVYALALLNCAAIWWLIYELVSPFIR